MAFESGENIIENRKFDSFFLKKKAVGILYQKDDDRKFASILLESTWDTSDDLIKITDVFYMAQDNAHSIPVFLGKNEIGADRIFQIKDNTIRSLFSLDKKFQNIVPHIIHNSSLGRSMVITAPYDAIEYPTNRMIGRPINRDNIFLYNHRWMFMALKNPDGTYDFYAIVGIFKFGEKRDQSVPYLWYYVQYERTNVIKNMS